MLLLERLARFRGGKGLSASVQRLHRELIGVLLRRAWSLIFERAIGQRIIPGIRDLPATVVVRAVQVDHSDVERLRVLRHAR